MPSLPQHSCHGHQMLTINALELRNVVLRAPPVMRAMEGHSRMVADGGRVDGLGKFPSHTAIPVQLWLETVPASPACTVVRRPGYWLLISRVETPHLEQGVVAYREQAPSQIRDGRLWELSLRSDIARFYTSRSLTTATARYDRILSRPGVSCPARQGDEGNTRRKIRTVKHRTRWHQDKRVLGIWAGG
ncbi:hypothetical protein ACCO45_005526 [Purpureocillium lilacinum]|uniref:Uncharacterized protein n=1 Tax=Purpureocillium lilacinum TaxID=33203 RepID=A0ACC4DVQ4_PURLI